MSQTTMTAAVLYGREDVRIERIPVPEPSAGEVVLRVAAALTCGTDLKVYKRGYHSKMLTPPALFGHEVAGIIEHVGVGVENFAVGDRVVALNSAPCGLCFYCRHDQQNLCDDLLFNNGAYAEYIRVPARIVATNMLLVPHRIELTHAALTEPLACVMLGLRDVHAQAGDTMAVIGAGPIGLLFIHAASLHGIRVIAVVKREGQGQAARAFGASEVVRLDETQDPIAAVRALTEDQRGADIVIEAVATPLTWKWAVDMVRKGGVVNFFGGPPSGTRVEFDTNRLHYNNIEMQATFHHTPASVREAFALITSGRFKSAQYITGQVTLGDLPALLSKMANRSASDCDIKTAIVT
jgi:L-iditol 2-dehydrogenase